MINPPWLMLGLHRPLILILQLKPMILGCGGTPKVGQGSRFTSTCDSLPQPSSSCPFSAEVDPATVSWVLAPWHLTQLIFAQPILLAVQITPFSVASSRCFFPRLLLLYSANFIQVICKFIFFQVILYTLAYLQTVVSSHIPTCWCILVSPLFELCCLCIYLQNSDNTYLGNLPHS